MTLALGLYLQTYLKTDPRLEVILARDLDGWNPVLKNYFDTHQNDISSFVDSKKATMRALESGGTLTKVTDGVEHVDARSDVALRLYGINKWAYENAVDMMIHIHFNEYPRSHQSKPGKYKGLVIYVPDPQYSNAKSTAMITNYILPRLDAVFPVSNLPKEDDGIVPDQDLIALGAYNTADMPSMLIEYGYIYDPLFSKEAKREDTLDSMAKQTYLGLEDFFTAGAKSN